LLVHLNEQFFYRKEFQIILVKKSQLFVACTNGTGGVYWKK